MPVVARLEDLPQFESYEEENAFWNERYLSPELWAEGQRGDPELDQALEGLTSVKVVPARGLKFA